MKNDKFIMTAEGYLEAETELNELKNVRRQEIIEAIKEARAQGDLSENADYDAARNEQAIVEAKIQELEYKLEHAQIIDNKNKNEVINQSGHNHDLNIELYAYFGKESEKNAIKSVQRNLLQKEIKQLHISNVMVRDSIAHSNGIKIILPEII